MGKKPDFAKAAKRRNSNISSILQQSSPAAPRKVDEPVEKIEEVLPTQAQKPIEPVRSISTKVSKQIDSRKKKLAHMKILMEYEEKKEINRLLSDIGDELGHSIQFSIFTRGLLLAALSHKSDFIHAAKSMAGIERPSNSDIEALRAYEEQIGQMVFEAFRLRGTAQKRKING